MSQSKEELIEGIRLLQKRIVELDTFDSAHKQQQQQDIRRYVTVVRNSNDAIIIQDIDGLIITWNRGAELMYGYNEKEALGMNIERLTPPGKVAEYKEFTRRLIAGETVASFETQRVTKDGRILDVWLTVTELAEEPADSIISTGRDITGLIGFALIERNITERKQIDSLKDEFIRIVSHELRTPLTVIREGVSQVLDGILGDTTAEQREFLSICLADIDRLERIIKGLLDISKVEAGKMQLKKGLIDIISMAKGIVSFFEPKAKEKGLELKASYSEEKIYAYVDADKMTQAFTNLVGNALKFTEKGRIEISVEEKGNNVECAVADTGIGISSGDLSRVFDKFQQFGRVVGGGEKGTGLGLSITKGIVGLHSGKIWVESEINKGTKFCFTLPKYTKEEILCESIESKIQIAKKEGKGLSLLLFKFDNYKEAEKIYGEEKLQGFFHMISEILKEAVRSGELVAEGGADEVILLEEVGKQNIPRMNARLKRAIKESIFEFEKERKINFSEGYAAYPDDADNAKDLLKKARLAMVSESQERLKKNIMIVDDEPVVIDALERLLRELGYNNFIRAHDGGDALAKIKNLTPDLVILDMKIPKMDGYMVVGKLKEDTNTKGVPILIMSGYKVEPDRLKNQTMKESIPMIEKPFSIEQLDRLVYYLL